MVDSAWMGKNDGRRPDRHGAGTAEDDLSPLDALGRGLLASIGRVIVVMCGLG